MVNARKDLKACGRVASMTGFAAREAVDPETGTRRAWELRSVNGRGLDLRLRLPDGTGALEAPLRKALSARVTRGNVTLSLRVSQDAGAEGARLDPEAVAVAVARLRQLMGAAAPHVGALSPPSAGDLYALMPGAARTEMALPDLAAVKSDLEPLLDAFCEMRAAEGAALAKGLSQRLDHIETLIAKADTAAAARGAGQAARLRAALAAVLDTTDAVDPDRLAQELALIAVKADVTEEIDRLRAHLAAARALLATGGPVGRKLDFLMQEFNREANTVCSKAGDTDLTAVGLDLKHTIDQMREQVQNLE